jgi:hypothetical protein
MIAPKFISSILTAKTPRPPRKIKRKIEKSERNALPSAAEDTGFFPIILLVSLGGLGVLAVQLYSDVAAWRFDYSPT